MISVNRVEHYVTIFDSNFLISGLALYESLMEVGEPFRLWVIATDQRVVEQLSSLKLSHAQIIPLAVVESQALRDAKKLRTVGEYCWTLTPFAPGFVFERDVDIERVTYLDSDLFFFQSPKLFFEELVKSGKDVLVTEHGYAPEYDRSKLNGRFCVQFLTFRNTLGGRKVMQWWQTRCIEWCFARYEDGKFGDQKYLDVWPEIFSAEVHILSATIRTLAPWNVDHYSQVGTAKPVFYHFQGFRILSSNCVKLYQGYRVHSRNFWIYTAYLKCIGEIARKLIAAGIPLPTMPEHRQRFRRLKYVVLRIQGKIKFIDPCF